jgi:hypothetical protein
MISMNAEKTQCDIFIQKISRHLTVATACFGLNLTESTTWRYRSSIEMEILCPGKVGRQSALPKQNHTISTLRPKQAGRALFCSQFQMHLMARICPRPDMKVQDNDTGLFPLSSVGHQGRHQQT